MIIRTPLKNPESVCLTDLETTGFSPTMNIPIQIAAVKIVHAVDDSLNMTKTMTLEFKLSMPAGVEVSEKVAALNGYNAEVWKRDAVSRKEAYSQYIDELQWSSFGGQNPKFDYNFLDEDFKRYGFEWPKLSYYGLVSVDTMARPLKLQGYIKSLKQAELCEFFGLGEQKHDALVDIEQCAEIYRRLHQLEVRGFTPENVQDVVSQKSKFC